METLLSFVAWAGMLFLVVGFGPHLMGRRWRLQPLTGYDEEYGRDVRWVPPAKDIDVVCGKVVTTEKAKPSVHAGSVHYFCSRECREIFETAPRFYLDNADAGPRRLEA